ncbi:MurR/RpiR family transcriptional regulator [Allokutzneria sp. A3M-2-11 16]|uniref:MurR/RpiR family transcriptional regulator n=1 Tax=Allokutzneria sp. A3M-2-11 16 TaxID=2962043 RepID=UPI0020B88623|nr:MurR/RpiR family transcriptional regulator [Allokutzneria sp. A3M-2-11 16]MCP3800475.1 MurR/RpiR family transcriptional regulator [Allokutzneria sp. A3M-2-11 16]
MSDAPTSFAELSELLRSESEGFTPSQRTLAERVLTDPEGIAFKTVSELARDVGVNEATVVRFAQRCGLSGYPALVKLCREHLSGQAQLVRRLGSLADAPDELLSKAVELDKQNLTRTLARVDPDAWRRAVGALAGARRVHVMGLRKSHSVAYLLAYLLDLVLDDVSLVIPGPGTLTDRLRRLESTDVLVAVSLHRYAADTVRAVRQAKSAGATTIALTDTAASPLADLADSVFFADTAGAGLLRSVTALVGLAQAMAAGVAGRRADQAPEALRRQEELLVAFNTYHP